MVCAELCRDLTDEFCSKESSLALSWRDRDDSFSELFDPSPVPASRQLQTPQVALSLEQHPVAVSCWTDMDRTVLTYGQC